MLKVSILLPVIKKTVAVNFFSSPEQQSPKAVLLGTSGEELKKFLLPDQENVLSLDDVAAGAYTLRVEAGIEVMSAQIIIP